jgi:hypothetical protein
VAEPTEEQLIKVADHILEDLLDRSGIGDQLSMVRGDDVEIYREIQLAIGRRAWDAVSENKTISSRDLDI